MGHPATTTVVAVVVNVDAPARDRFRRPPLVPTRAWNTACRSPVPPFGCCACAAPDLRLTIPTACVQDICCWLEPGSQEPAFDNPFSTTPSNTTSACDKEKLCQSMYGDCQPVHTVSSMCTFNMTLLEDQNRQAFAALFQARYRMMTGQSRRRLQQYPQFPSSTPTPKPQPGATGPEPGASGPPGFGDFPGGGDFDYTGGGGMPIPEEHTEMLGKLQEMGIDPEDWDPAKGPPEDVLAKFSGDDQALLKEMLEKYSDPDNAADPPYGSSGFPFDIPGSGGTMPFDFGDFPGGGDFDYTGGGDMPIPEEHTKMLGKLQEMGIDPEDWDPAKGPPEDVLAKFSGDDQALLKEMLEKYGGPDNAADFPEGGGTMPFDFGDFPFEGDFGFGDSTGGGGMPGQDEYSGPKPMSFEDYLEAVKKTVKRFPKACCAESEAACTQDADCKWESHGDGFGMCRALDPRLADLPSVWPEYKPDTPTYNQCEHSDVRTPPDPAALGGID